MTDGPGRDKPAADDLDAAADAHDRFSLTALRKRAEEERPPRFGGAVAEQLEGSHRRDLIDLFFAPGPVPEDQPVVIFHHIRKTGGTAIRAVLSRNLVGTNHRFQYAPRKDDDEETIAGWFEQFHRSLRRKERSSLVCAAGHTASYLMPVLKRPARLFTVLREPVDRVLSRYLFFGSPPWTLKELYSGSKEDRKPEFFNGVTRALLEPHCDVSELPTSIETPPDADLWRTRVFGLLAEHYTVGIQERLDASLELFARQFGFQDLDLRPVRVNTERPPEFELDLETYESIRAANWLDIEVYRHFAQVFDRDVSRSVKDDSPGATALRHRRGYVVKGSRSGGDDLEDLQRRVERLERRLHADTVASQVRMSVLGRRVEALDRNRPKLFVARRTKGDAAAGSSPAGGSRSRKASAAKKHKTRDADAEA